MHYLNQRYILLISRLISFKTITINECMAVVGTKKRKKHLLQITHCKNCICGDWIRFEKTRPIFVYESRYISPRWACVRLDIRKTCHATQLSSHFTNAETQLRFQSLSLFEWTGAVIRFFSKANTDVQVAKKPIGIWEWNQIRCTAQSLCGHFHYFNDIRLNMHYCIIRSLLYDIFVQKSIQPHRYTGGQLLSTVYCRWQLYIVWQHRWNHYDMILFHNFMTQCKSVMDSFVLKHEENKIQKEQNFIYIPVCSVFTSGASIERRVAARN